MSFKGYLYGNYSVNLQVNLRWNWSILHIYKKYLNLCLFLLYKSQFDSRESVTDDPPYWVGTRSWREWLDPRHDVNAECQNQNSGIAVPAKMYESIPCKIWTFWRFQRHIVWSSLLHSSSRCPIWEVVTVHIHRIICTFLLFVINVMFLIDFFPYFCWFCFSYRQYDIQNYVHPVPYINDMMYAYVNKCIYWYK